jgi:hypothetical protein
MVRDVLKDFQKAIEVDVLLNTHSLNLYQISHKVMDEKLPTFKSNRF